MRDMTKQCDLCELPARMHCESDQANLCWACDAKVHGANFLVARHSRILLCRSCQSPTPWRASGAWLSPTVSVCEPCLQTGGGGAMDRAEYGGGDDAGRMDVEADESRNLAIEDDEEGDDDEEGEGEEEEEEGEIQVVPWSSVELEPTAPVARPPPPVASCSSGDESSSSRAFLKRMRQNADLASSHQVEAGLSPSGYRRQSPTTAAAGGLSSGRFRDGGGGSAPPGPVGPPGQPSLDLPPRGGSRMIDVVSPSFHSPPI